jgi:hypothetical protein
MKFRVQEFDLLPEDVGLLLWGSTMPEPRGKPADHPEPDV